MPETNKNRKASGRLGVTLFGGIFLLVGLGVLAVGPLETFYQHFRSSSWVSVPVALQDISVESHRGDDSTTYSVHARYSYRFDGRQYSSGRVGYDWGSDNIGDFHRQILGRVRTAEARGELRAWVNPASPGEAYLVRDLRWKKLVMMSVFGLVFTAAGAGVIAMGWRRQSALLAGKEVIYSSERYGHWVLAFMAFMFIGISLPAVIEIPAEWRKGNQLILVALLFPLVGMGMAWGSWKMRRNWRYYGALPLQMEPSPGQLGGDVAGTITLPRWIECSDWRVTLQCVRIRISGGKNSSRSESVVWQDEQAPYVEMQGIGAAIRFVFTPPADLPESDDEGREKVEWRLLLSGPRHPVPLDRTYAVPVATGSVRASRPLPPSHVDRSEKKAALLATAAAAEQIDVQPLADGLRLVSRAGRNTAMAFMLVLMGLIFGGVGIGLFIAAAKEGAMLYFMGLVFASVGFPMLLGGLFMAGRSLQVSIRDGQVETVRYWLGMALWRRSAVLSNAGQLVLSSGGKTSMGRRTVEYFHLQVGDKGKQVRIAEGLEGRDVAEALEGNLIRLLRLS